MAQLLTITEAKNRLGCSRQWVHYLISVGKLKARLIGGIWILREQDLESVTLTRANGTKGAKRRGRSR